MSEPHVIHRVDRERRQYDLVLNRPERLNAFTAEMYSSIRAGILRAEAEPEIDVIVISAAPGKAFATGGDLAEWLEVLSLPRPDAYTRFDTDWRFPFDAILQSSKTVIAAVDGICWAGGLVIALASDIVVATRSSTFAVPEARVGVYEPGTELLLPKVVGLSRARYMIATAATLDAETAERWGIVARLVVDREALDKEVEVLVEAVSGTSPSARALYKRGILGDLRGANNLSIMQTALTENAIEGLEAFRDRRPPQWRRGGADAGSAN